MNFLNVVSSIYYILLICALIQNITMSKSNLCNTTHYKMLWPALLCLCSDGLFSQLLSHLYQTTIPSVHAITGCKCLIDQLTCLCVCQRV
ncbi:hypothetical protein GDO86_017619 [Hymenochirus boettgeri]|uniref:Uncharacterized protein n=1 Tax=Hymenochirus boettgeri TaxID=247094 RepID=A0A8T2IP80_9PIPI|nr:hypothetical protein GDO86_017619 [Hymenochirus boettgeri]